MPTFAATRVFRQVSSSTAPPTASNSAQKLTRELSTTSYELLTAPESPANAGQRLASLSSLSPESSGRSRHGRRRNWTRASMWRPPLLRPPRPPRPPRTGRQTIFRSWPRRHSLRTRCRWTTCPKAWSRPCRMPREYRCNMQSYFSTQVHPFSAVVAVRCWVQRFAMYYYYHRPFFPCSFCFSLSFGSGSVCKIGRVTTAFLLFYFCMAAYNGCFYRVVSSPHFLYILEGAGVYIHSTGPYGPERFGQTCMAARVKLTSDKIIDDL